MQSLISQIRQEIPFDVPEAYVCSGKCNGCSLKLLDFLDLQLNDWEERLKQGENPGFGDIKKLARMGVKIHRVLSGNGLVV